MFPTLRQLTFLVTELQPDAPRRSVAHAELERLRRAHGSLNSVLDSYDSTDIYWIEESER
jgi:hypothetical protein